MASIIKRGKYFRAYVARRGYKRQSKTFDTKAQAEAWAKSVESEMSRRVYRDNSEAFKLTLGDALKRYEENISTGKKGHRQERSRISAWREHPLGEHTLGELRPSHFADYRDAMKKSGKAANTIRLNLALISHLFTVARKEWGYESLANPLDAVTKPKGSQKRERRISGAEVQAIIAASDSEVLPVVLQLALETAMRRSELIKTLLWKHVDLDARVAHLRDTKGGTPRNVPLSTEAVALLGSLQGERKGRVFKVAVDSITQAFIRARRRARSRYELDCAERGVEPEPEFLINVRFHDARHEATSTLFEKGLNVMEAAAVTGHRDLKTLQRYTHFNASKLADKLDAHGTQHEPIEHPHPGEKLREYLPTARKFAEAAKLTGVSKRELQEIVAGRARIDAELAVRLERLGPHAEMWAEMQVHHDIWQIRQRRVANPNGERRKGAATASH